MSTGRPEGFTRRRALGLAGSGLAGWAVSARGLGGGDLPVFPDPEEGVGEGFTVVVFPDTQNYAKYAKNQGIFEGMTRWVAEHHEAWKVAYALHVGDLVEQNDIEEGGGRGWGDQNGAEQWASAKRALGQLRGLVPVLIATGNHDYGLRNAEDRRTRFTNYFGLTDDPLVADGRGGGMWLESAPNSFGAKTLENAAYEYVPAGGRRHLVLCLEWGPRRAVVEWAKGLLAREAFRDHLCVLNVHSYLRDDGERSGDHGRPGNPHWYGTGEGGDTHDGEDLWRELVGPAAQLELVVCGHEMGRHVAYRSDRNAAGRTVHQMLFNAQGLGGGSDERGNGGDGWLRLLSFSGDGQTVTVRQFSPHLLGLGRDPWWRSPEHSFVLRFDA